MTLRSLVPIALALTSLAGCAPRVVSDWRSQIPWSDVLLDDRRGPRDVPAADEALAAATNILTTTKRSCGTPWGEDVIASSAIPYSSYTVTQGDVVAWLLDWPAYDAEGLDTVETDRVLIAARAMRPDDPDVFTDLLSLESHGSVGEQRRWRLASDSWEIRVFAEVGCYGGIMYDRYPSIDCLERGDRFDEIPVGRWEGIPSGWVTARTRRVGFDEAAWLRHFDQLPVSLAAAQPSRLPAAGRSE
jgi:hypothetical protein